MSAWLVSEDHINVMITWAMDNGVFLPSPGTPEDACRILTNANMRSLRARYAGREFLADWERPARKYRFKRINVRELLERRLKAELIVGGISDLIVAGQIRKCCDCYDYQSCEDDRYPKSSAAKFVEAVRSRSRGLFPGEHRVLYDRLIWGL
jgi:hypothetical protein